MTILSHFVAGSAICRYVRWKPAGLTLAFASHLILDALPHFEHYHLLPGAQQPWGRGIPVVVSLLTLPLLLLVWRQATTRWSRAVAIYLIAGGLLGCLLDGLTIVFGHHSLPGRLNNLPHLLWAPAYRHAAGVYGVWSPLAAPLSIAVELAVLALGSWLLFRRGKKEN